MRRLCVFTGSNAGARPEYAEAAATLGRTLAARGVGLVYGGGHVGLMGIVADSCLKAGGEVIGVIPKFLMDLEVGHGALTDLRVVNTMHERKALMADLSDGFIALPGGIGTMEELFEVWTWGQLGEHEKPVALLDVAGYYDAMRAFIDHMVAEGFLRDHHRAMLMVEHDAAPLLDRLEAYEPPKQQKWVTPATR
ncbi:Lysine decarboxylase family [Caenispirillum salinarum AK4]|uniref:Cytokinin riboside 5'-monophosphate phosphoribohydrolase n=1 Tax=Caenispirillum salinarum AK4 TaxID=1238182 RepID=K9GJK8_9PROT|nr:TIGR00730 family Rossman fold protein [Caenispirillum salinarum]EKV26145.1 Lysine decarboxylase family [Caenispirillum salinarum AK4]